MNVICPPGVTKEEAMQRLLLDETRLNEPGPLRYHFQDPKFETEG